MVVPRLTITSDHASSSGGVIPFGPAQKIKGICSPSPRFYAGSKSWAGQAK
jgi:hypothetical protein